MRYSGIKLEGLVGLFAAVAVAEERAASAKALATFLGADDCLLFVTDEELEVYLPAAGFPRTLSGRSGWRELVSQAARDGSARGEMVSPFSGGRGPALAVAGGGAVLVLFGEPASPPEDLVPLIALLGHSLGLERRAITMQGELALSQDAMREAGSLSAQLDVARRDLEKRVRERTAALEEAVKEMTGFTYTVAHDLRAPLRAIVSTSNILLEELGDGLDEEHRHMLGRQVYNGNRLGTLIDELLKLSRLSRQEMRLTDIDVSVLAREVADEALRDHDESSATVEVQPGMRASADASLLRLLLVNLIDNAIKFSPQGGLIEVREAGGTFTVRDRGTGFDMAYVEKIFLPFERLVGIEEVPGTGIGLANAKRIVERHGGQIWAESEPGKGTVLSFRLGGVFRP